LGKKGKKGKDLPFFHFDRKNGERQGADDVVIATLGKRKGEEGGEDCRN